MNENETIAEAVANIIAEFGLFDDWLERYGKLWEERFDRLEEYLRDLQAKEAKDARKRK